MLPLGILGTGHAGIAMNFDEGVSSPALLREWNRTWRACSLNIQPWMGVCFSRKSKDSCLRKTDVEFVARLKRVAWLVFLGPRSFQKSDSQEQFLKVICRRIKSHSIYGRTKDW